MTSRSLILRVAVGAAFVFTTHAQALAQRGQSCESLWYQRNAIYAANGYCFNTARAINTFGRGCFPPYGRLSRSEQRQVARLQAMSNRRGCPN